MPSRCSSTETFGCELGKPTTPRELLTKAKEVNSRDPKLTVLLFNENINRQDLEGLTRQMAQSHTFIDRDGTAHGPKPRMVEEWKEFFQRFPKYRNNFSRVESHDDLVVVLGHAFWSEEQPFDPVIWTARVEDDLVVEWRICSDSKENRAAFNLR